MGAGRRLQAAVIQRETGRRTSPPPALVAVHGRVYAQRAPGGERGVADTDVLVLPAYKTATAISLGETNDTLKVRRDVLRALCWFYLHALVRCPMSYVLCRCLRVLGLIFLPTVNPV